MTDDNPLLPPFRSTELKTKSKGDLRKSPLIMGTTKKSPLIKGAGVVFQAFLNYLMILVSFCLLTDNTKRNPQS